MSDTKITKAAQYLQTAATSLTATKWPDKAELAYVCKDLIRPAFSLLRAAIVGLEYCATIDFEAEETAGGTLFESVKEPAPVSVPAPVAEPLKPLPTLAHNEGAIDVEAEPALQPHEVRDAFTLRLDTLRKEGIEAGLDFKKWSRTRKAWEAIYKADPRAALEAIKMALKATHITWEPPTLEEIP